MERRPRILVTNDDGYTSQGIQVLADALEALGEVWVVAPNREQSAVSHALTLHRPLRAERLGEHRFSVDGTPTDCVTLAAGSLMAGAPPDIVVSGINFGANMGVDVHYSGTVSAAFEGVILGFPAIAVSQLVGEEFSFHPAARFARQLTDWVLRHGLPPNTLLNVNVPVEPPRGVRLTRLGSRRYTEGVIEQNDPRGRQIYWIGGGEPQWDSTPGTDFPVAHGGLISVTPLHLDMTERRFLEKLQRDLPSWAEAGEKSA
ncbi:MAG: 5'/3'-nucleotidase SurE [Acidobacteria bacterium]|jgi:5'-nucleotidase|nr:5'/3'-nucleotidase SurE [Acidobacteriota bacterium]